MVESIEKRPPLTDVQLKEVISQLREVVRTDQYPDIDPSASMSEAGRQLIAERRRVVGFALDIFEIAAGLADPVIDLPGDCRLPLNLEPTTLGAQLDHFMKGGSLIGQVPDIREVPGATTKFQG